MEAGTASPVAAPNNLAGDLQQAAQQYIGQKANEYFGQVVQTTQKIVGQQIQGTIQSLGQSSSNTNNIGWSQPVQGNNSGLPPTNNRQ